VSFTALLLEQFAPASTVADELALADADALLELLLALDEVPAAGVEELLPPLHAARPVTAAMAAMPPRASRDRLLDPVLSLFIGGELLCFLCFSAGALCGDERATAFRARR
jgi:hypothetical protein